MWTPQGKKNGEKSSPFSAQLIIQRTEIPLPGLVVMTTAVRFCLTKYQNPSKKLKPKDFEGRCKCCFFFIFLVPNQIQTLEGEVTLQWSFFCLYAPSSPKHDQIWLRRTWWALNLIMTSQWNLQSDFLIGFSQNKSALGKAVAAGLQHLQRGSEAQPEAQSYSALTAASGSAVSFLNLLFFIFLHFILVWRQLWGFRGRQHVQHPRAQLFRQRDALTSPLVQAWPPPSYPHSRGCKRHTKRDFKVKKNQITLLSVGHS